MAMYAWLLLLPLQNWTQRTEVLRYKGKDLAGNTQDFSIQVACMVLPMSDVRNALEQAARKFQVRQPSPLPAVRREFAHT